MFQASATFLKASPIVFAVIGVPKHPSAVKLSCFIGVLTAILQSRHLILAVSIISAIIAYKSLERADERYLKERKCEKPLINLVARAYCPGPLSEPTKKYALFSLIFENPSKLDIAITRIFLECNGQVLEFKWQPDVMCHRKNCKIRTEQLPIHIPALGAFGGYFIVYNKHNIDIDFTELTRTNFKIKIHTSRGYEPEFSFTNVALKYDI